MKKRLVLANLQIKVMLLFVLLALAPLGIMGALAIKTAEELIISMVKNQIKHVAADKATLLERWISERKADLEVIAGSSICSNPYFLCNAGGVTVSYFEMVQNAYMYYWEEQEIHDKLDHRMTRAYHEVLDTSKKFKINIRQAAYAVAVERVVEAMKLRGWI